LKINYILLPVLISIIFSFLFPEDRYLAAGPTLVIIFIYFIVIIGVSDPKKNRKYIYFASIALSGLSVEIFKTSVSELIVWIVFLATIQTNDYKNNHLPILVKYPIIIFALFGLVTMIFQSYSPHLETWRVTCILPLVIFSLAFYYIKNLKDVKLALLMVCVSLSIYLGMSLLARLVGFGEDDNRIWILNSYDQLSFWVNWGAAFYPFWPNVAGALVSMVSVTAITLFLWNDNKLEKLIFGFFFLICVYVLYLTKGRAASAAFLISLLIVLLFSLKKKNKLKYISEITGIAIIIILLYFSMSVYISSFTYNRFISLLDQGGINSGSGLYRMELFARGFADNGIIGIGFHTLGGLYNLDDATLYTWLINGTGFIGSGVIIGLIFYLAYKYFKKIVVSDHPFLPYYIIGFATILSTLISAFSDNAIMNYTFSAIPFWTILATSLKVIYIEENQL